MLAHSGPAGDDPVGAARDGGAYRRIQRHLDALWQRQAAAITALRAACDQTQEAISEYAQAVGSTLGLIEAEVQIARAAAAAGDAPDGDAFTAAVEDELAAWRLYLERLQRRAALNGGDARVQAEDAIRELRRRRSALARSLERARPAAARDRLACRRAVTAAHDALVRALDEASPKFE